MSKSVRVYTKINGNIHYMHVLSVWDTWDGIKTVEVAYVVPSPTFTDIQKLTDQVQRAHKTIERLQSALRFYEDERNHRGAFHIHTTNGGYEVDVTTPAVQRDGGKIARDAIKVCEAS